MLGLAELDGLADPDGLAEPLGDTDNEPDELGDTEVDGDTECDGDADWLAVVMVGVCHRPSVSTKRVPPAVRNTIDPCP